MDKVMRFIDVMNAFKLCAALAVADLIAAGIYKIKEGISGTDQGHNTRQLPNDSSGNVLFYRRLCDRSRINGCNISVERKEPQKKQKPHTSEEKIMVLNTMRMGATWYEKSVIDEIAEDLYRIMEKENENE